MVAPLNSGVHVKRKGNVAMDDEHDWKAYLEPKNPVMELFAGGSAKSVSAMPICADTPMRPFQARRIVEKWVERMRDAGTESMDLAWQDYVDVRAEVYGEIFTHYLPRLSWYLKPVQANREKLVDSKLTIRDDQLFHLASNGREYRMGDLDHPSSSDIRTGSSSEVEITWDSTLGWISFKDNANWDPPANRVADFKKGIKYKIVDFTDPDGPSEDVEPWVPEYAMGGTEVLNAICEATGRQHTPYGNCTSPFESTCYQLGFEGLMESMYLEPELVHEATAMAQPKDSPGFETMKQNGIGILYMFQMFGGGDLFGPRQFEQFVMPAVQKALDFFHERGFWIVYYPMGNATPHLEPLKDLNWDALSLEESRKGYEIDIRRVRQVMGADRLLFGNMTVDHIDQGNREAMLKEARYQIKYAGESGRFILSCGTPIMPGTPAENVRYFCELPDLI